jgi:protein O-GlcNAc transferase
MDESSCRPRVVIVSATMQSASHFGRSTLLGRSLQAFPSPLRPGLLLLPANSGQQALGLAEFYNQAIGRIEGDPIVVFCHDDVYLHDWNLCHVLAHGLGVFDLLGVVGAAHVPWGQPGWWFTLDTDHQPVRNDSVQRSGSLNHFDPCLVRPDYYGPCPKACDLLDGVFLAVKMSTLKSSGLRFDPQFRFHCYDSDFCYAARKLGLRVGTWPVPITHGSPGEFGQSWVNSALLLCSKLSG